MRAIGWQLDQVDTALWPCKELPDIRSLVIGGIIPNDMDEAFVGVACLNLGEQLRGTGPIHRSGLDKGRIEGLKVKRAMDVHPPAP